MNYTYKINETLYSLLKANTQITEIPAILRKEEQINSFGSAKGGRKLKRSIIRNTGQWQFQMMNGSYRPGQFYVRASAATLAMRIAGKS